MGGIFGGGSSGTTKVTTKRYIPPQTPIEASALSRLYDEALYDYYRPSEKFISALQVPYVPSEDFIRTMQEPYLSMLPYKEKIGKAINELARRGVLNSTITQRTLSDIGRWALERGAELRTRTLPLLEEARRLSKADEIKRLAMLEDAERLASDDRFRHLFNLWSTLYQGRMGAPTTVTSYDRPSLLSQALGEATGLGLGYWLGPGGGIGKIGGVLRGVLSRIGGWF